MILDREFRVDLARKLLERPSLPAMTRRRADAVGFRAFLPIENFLNSLEPYFRDRPKACEEGALEALGIVAAPPTSPMVESLYRSAFLDALRAEQAKTGALYRRLSIEDETSKALVGDGLNRAFAQGEQILKREAESAPRERVDLNERIGINWFSSVLNRNLLPLGFSRAAKLEKCSHLVYTRQSAQFVFVFVFDKKRPLQLRFLVSPSVGQNFDIFTRRDAVEIPLQATSFALMAGGRPYLTPNGTAECDRSVQLIALAASLIMERLDGPRCNTD